MATHTFVLEVSTHLADDGADTPPERHGDVVKAIEGCIHTAASHGFELPPDIEVRGWSIEPSPDD